MSRSIYHKNHQMHPDNSETYAQIVEHHEFATNLYKAGLWPRSHYLRYSNELIARIVHIRDGKSGERKHEDSN